MLFLKSQHVIQKELANLYQKRQRIFCCTVIYIITNLFISFDDKFQQVKIPVHFMLNF